MRNTAIINIQSFLMRQNPTLAPLFLFFAFTANNAFGGELSVASIFSDGMVLQRKEPLPVWGWADSAGTMAFEFNGQKKSATAGTDGRWQVKLNAMQALNTGRRMTVDCGDQSMVINDVVVGEGWFCSGQSNMTVWLGFLTESPVKEKRYQPIVDDTKKEIETERTGGPHQMRLRWDVDSAMNSNEIWRS